MSADFVKKTKRAIAGFIAVAITFAVSPSIPVKAEDETDMESYFSSLDPNSTEYQEWKEEYASAYSVSTLALSNSSNRISNDYIKLLLPQLSLEFYFTQIL